jgi:hypothetical protein
MTFVRKIFARDTKVSVDRVIGAEKCPHCNWEAGRLYRIGKAGEDEMCGNCLAAYLVAKGYRIMGED